VSSGGNVKADPKQDSEAKYTAAYHILLTDAVCPGLREMSFFVARFAMESAITFALFRW
jgi:hypothetical protein